ncbi:MAG: PIN domain-containing protein [Clostridiales bacterium]|nr:PIN domain-containing protein [Clostridiales bacterium]
MRILIDTNVILDVLFEREPFAADSITVLHMCEDGVAEAVVSAKTVSDVYDFLKTSLQNEEKSHSIMRKLMGIATICSLDVQQLETALDMNNDDFGDALQAACAKAEGCKLIISRDKKHFQGTGVKCLTPEEFVK